MWCPRCNSGAVVRLPANRISPHPGYECTACGCRMRARGLAAVYLLAIVLALGLIVLLVWLLLSEQVLHLRGTIVGLGVGIVVVVYSVVQLLRPAPRRGPMSAEPIGRADPGAPADGPSSSL
jgi:hypothetical protein